MEGGKGAPVVCSDEYFSGILAVGGDLEHINILSEIKFSIYVSLI